MMKEHYTFIGTVPFPFTLIFSISVLPCSEIQSIRSPVQEHMAQVKQPSLHNLSFSDKKERESPLSNGRSMSLMDLKDSPLLHGLTGPLPLQEAPPRLGRAGSQASIGPLPPPPPYLQHPQQQHFHREPVTAVVLRDNLPQSAPQVRRPLHPSLNQQRSLQPLSFQNPVYHLSNLHTALVCPAGSLQPDSSSENLSTTGSSRSASLGASGSHKKHHPSKSSSLDGEEPGHRGPQGEKETPPPLSGAHWCPPGAQAMARHQSPETAHIVKVEQQWGKEQNRSQAVGNGRQRPPRSLPHSVSLHSSSSVNTEPQQQSGPCSRQQSACSRDSPSTRDCPNRQVHHFCFVNCLLIHSSNITCSYSVKFFMEQIKKN